MEAFQGIFGTADLETEEASPLEPLFNMDVEPASLPAPDIESQADENVQETSIGEYFTLKSFDCLRSVGFINFIEIIYRIFLSTGNIGIITCMTIVPDNTSIFCDFFYFSTITICN